MSLSQALSVESAVLSATRVDASASDALVGVRTVVVSLTLSLIAYDRFAVAVGVCDLIDRTFADQSSEWDRVHDAAGLISTANVGSDARILAVLVDASELRCALGVDCALRSWRRLLDQTFNVRISSCSISAETVRLMFRSLAECVGSTRLFITDRSTHSV